MDNGPPSARLAWQFDNLLPREEAPNGAPRTLSHTEITDAIRQQLPPVENSSSEPPRKGLLEHSLDPITEDVRLLGSILGLVIREHAGEDFYRSVEKLRQVAKLARREPGGPNWTELANIIDSALKDHPPAQAVSWLGDWASAFQLLLALCRIAETVHYQRSNRGLDAVLAQMAQHASADEMDRASHVEVRLVATAHPTRISRHRILAHHAEVYELLKCLRAPGLANAFDQMKLVQRLAEKIEVLWATQFSRTEKPHISDDIDHTVTFFKRTMYDSLSKFHKNLDRVYHYRAGHALPNRRQPRVTLGTWVGSDMANNPSITPEVFAEALGKHHRTLLQRYIDDLEEIAPRLSHAGYRATLSAQLANSLDSELEEMASYGLNVGPLMRHRKREPYRLKLELIAERLRQTLDAPLLDAGGARPPFSYTGVAALKADLAMVDSSLEQAGYHRSRVQEFDLLRRKVNNFGFHALSMDLRERSDVILLAGRAVLEENRTQTTGLSREQLAEQFTTQLEQDSEQLIAPLFSEFDPLPGGFEDQAEVRRLFSMLNVARRARRSLGEQSVRGLVLTACGSTVEVLSALMLLRAQGLYYPDGQRAGREHAAESMFLLIPLFDTIEDLRRAPEILSELFQNRAYRGYLGAGGGRQLVMLGYSDTSKDAGYFTSNWEIYRAQQAVLDVGRQHDIKIRFFHGRGGSIGRGGGPTQRAVMAMPPGSTRNGQDVTEQGEVLARYYSVDDDAQAHFANLVGSLWARQVAVPPIAKRGWLEAAHEVAAVAAECYHGLLAQPDFVQYFEQVTPKEVELVKLGTKPERIELASSVADIRAIPWVFRWVQSRQMIPAWYGLGSALERFTKASQDSETALLTLKEMYDEWPFFKSVISNCETALRHTDMDIARYYVQTLASPQAPAEQILKLIRQEYHSTLHELSRVTGHRLLEDQAELDHSISLKEPYLDPLNYIQVRLLKDYRRELAAEASPDLLELYERAIVSSIEGIATGLGTTG